MSGRCFGNDGIPIGEELQISDVDLGQRDPDVAMDASGNFVVVWRAYEQAGDVPGIYGQRFDAQANPLGLAYWSAW